MHVPTSNAKPDLFAALCCMGEASEFSVSEHSVATSLASNVRLVGTVVSLGRINPATTAAFLYPREALDLASDHAEGPLC